MPNPAPSHHPQQTIRPVKRRLIIAGASIGLAIGALALVDQLRSRPANVAPSHEPSQLLIATPAPESEMMADKGAPPNPPPPPPKIVNSETLPSPPRTVVPTTVPAVGPAGPGALGSARIYVVQVGTFSSPANAQALQKQLQRAGIQARLETRVQLGPFKEKRDADKALARARKLGIEAVLVSSR